jgi:hypothetical protein
VRFLLVVHAVLGAVTVMVFTHLVVWSFAAVRGRAVRRAGIRWFGSVGLVAYVVQFVLGNLIYPAFKLHVRVAVLDRSPDTSWVGHLFEKKEHVAALALPLVVLAVVLAHRRQPDRVGTIMLFASSTIIATCAWFAALAGLIVTSFRAIG